MFELYSRPSANWLIFFTCKDGISVFLCSKTVYKFKCDSYNAIS